jgi:hypothetical protein
MTAALKPYFLPSSERDSLETRTKLLPTLIRIGLIAGGLLLIMVSQADARTPFRIGYIGDKTLTVREREQLYGDERALNEIIQSPCFSDYFEKKRSRLLRTGGRSRREVVEHIRASLPTVIVSYYRTANRTHGYRNPRSSTCGDACSRTVHLNRYYTDSSKWKEGCPRMGLKGHEMLHVLGYGHDYKRTADRPFSVPYSFNAMMNECCPKWAKGEL